MAKEYFLGVDGGGTNTRAWLANASGEIVGRGTGTSCNFRSVGINAAFDALQSAVRVAREKAQIERAKIRGACFGIAGADSPGDHAELQARLHDFLPNAQIEIVNDSVLILAAGTPQGWGIGVISGTGSICFGKTADGRTARGGGWGYLLGDEGSGYGIGISGLRAVARAADARAPQTALTPQILAHWNLQTPNDLIQKVYAMKESRTEIASLARIVDSAACEGDAIANEIMRTAAHELALAANVVADALQFENEIPCAIAGGVFLQSMLLEKLFRDAALEMKLPLQPIERVEEPVRGALVLARNLRTE